jgi:hypothetical protein
MLWGLKMSKRFIVTITTSDDKLTDDDVEDLILDITELKITSIDVD